jgi:hypothetical protein
MRQEGTMRRYRALALPIVSALCLITASAAEEQASRDAVLRELAQRIPPGTVSSEQTFETNGFHIESSRYKQLDTDFKPNGDEFTATHVSAKGAFTVAVTKGVSPTDKNGVDVFLGDTRESLLTVADSDGDGRPNVLSYYAVDKAGKHTVQVTDYDMDGQPDYKVDFVEHRVELWHSGRWYTVEKRDGRRGIVLDGRFVELQQEHEGSFTRYFVP